MEALYINKGKLTFRKHYPLPVLNSNEALIKVRLAGICSTDLELVKGYKSFHGVPGHEFVGEVVKVFNKEKKPLVGKRVVSNINLGCGRCEYCKLRIIEHCVNGRSIGIIEKDGAFAQFISLPISNLYEIPKNVEDRQAVFIEPLAAALRIPDIVHIPLKNKIAVLGPGRLGILVSQVLSLSGVTPIVIGRNLKSLYLPKKLGLATDLIENIKNKVFDLVIDVTGNEEGFKHSLRLVKPLGKIVVKSTYNGNLNINFSKVVVDEITIVGSRCGPFAPAIELLSKKRINTDVLIDKVYSLSDGIKAFEYAANPGVKKVLLKP